MQSTPRGRSTERSREVSRESSVSRAGRNNKTGEFVLFVGNLKPIHTEEVLGEYFGHFGEIERIQLPKEKIFGFITFVSPRSVDEAIKETYHRIADLMVLIFILFHLKYFNDFKI